METDTTYHDPAIGCQYCCECPDCLFGPQPELPCKEDPNAN
jgi:hypothetical protein